MNWPQTPTIPRAEQVLPSSTSALELRGVSSGYGGSPVLHDATVVVAPGSVVALLGANGAGKSTLMRTASGLLSATTGSIRLFGSDITSSRPGDRLRAGLCHIPEGRGIFRSLSVLDNLRLSAPPWLGKPNIDSVVEIFPILGQRMTQTAGSLSGGQQQMLALSRAFLSEPRVVMLDEVSLGLAPIVVDEIFAALMILRDNGAALLIVEQYVSRALAIADAVYTIKKGLVTFAGTVAEVSEEILVQEYMGVDES